jgi:hypothetical protein
MMASLSFWRSLRFSGFFHSATGGSLEIFRELHVAGASGFVPDLAADLIQRVGGGLDDVPRVKANDRVRAALGDRPGDPLGVVAGHQADLPAALFAQQIHEFLDRFAVTAERRPHQPAGVMVDYSRCAAPESPNIGRPGDEP